MGGTRSSTSEMFMEKRNFGLRARWLYFGLVPLQGNFNTLHILYANNYRTWWNRLFRSKRTYEIITKSVRLCVSMICKFEHDLGATLLLYYVAQKKKKTLTSTRAALKTHQNIQKSGSKKHIALETLLNEEKRHPNACFGWQWPMRRVQTSRMGVWSWAVTFFTGELHERLCTVKDRILTINKKCQPIWIINCLQTHSAKGTVPPEAKTPFSRSLDLGRLVRDRHGQKSLHPRVLSSQNGWRVDWRLSHLLCWEEEALSGAS